MGRDAVVVGLSALRKSRFVFRDGGGGGSTEVKLGRSMCIFTLKTLFSLDILDVQMGYKSFLKT